MHRVSTKSAHPGTKVNASYLVGQLRVIVRDSVQGGAAKATREEVLAVELATAIGSEMGKVHPDQWLHEGQKRQLLCREKKKEKNKKKSEIEQ